MNLYSIVPVMLKSEHYMSDNTKFLHQLTLDVASWAMYALELLSIIIIVFTTVVAFCKLFRHERYARVYLLHGQSIGLSFKLGAEILRTVTATSLLDIFEVFLLIVIKACMVLLIERELRSTDSEGIEDTEHGEKTPHVQHSKKPHTFSFHSFLHGEASEPAQSAAPAAKPADSAKS